MITRGQRLLLALTERTERRAIAARCAVSASCVSEWLSGDARPCPRARVELERSYGIGIEDWSKPHAIAGRLTY